jgi:hypothetical protein
MTAPTNEQAALERTRGVICSSTFLAGLERNTVPSVDPQDLEEEGEVHEGDGEGGLDEDFFQALSRSAEPITPIPAISQRMSAGMDAWGAEIEADSAAIERAKEAHWEEEKMEKGRKDVQSQPRASRHWPEERRCAESYGIGYKLLNRMGWKAESELKLISQEEKLDRRGIGFLNVQRAVPELTSEEQLEASLKQVHNDKVGHFGKLRTYHRLRRLAGFPWGVPTKMLHDKVHEWVEGCLTCQKTWRIRGQIEGASGALIRQRPFTEVSLDLITL